MEHSYHTKADPGPPVYCRACESYDCLVGRIERLEKMLKVFGQEYGLLLTREADEE